MGWFSFLKNENRKKEAEKVEQPPIISTPCQHKYRDFPWYIDDAFDFNSDSFEINVVEPYVCVWCGNRKNVVLDTSSGIGSLQFEQREISRLTNLYKSHIKPRGIVENDIHDMQLVDRDYLKALSKVRPEATKGLDEDGQVILNKEVI